MYYIGVIGESATDRYGSETAFEVGRLIAGAGAVLVCGGMSGIMEHAARGAKSAGGTTIGILPGSGRDEANKYIDIAIPTGLGEARNLIVVRSSDAIVAIGGQYGTLSEIAFALRFQKPVVGLNTWELRRKGSRDTEIIEAESPGEAIDRILSRLQNPQ
jgi:uncharacterized protein (TIGR00725 family)